MTNKDKNALLKKEIMAIDEKDILRPNVSIDDRAEEAESLAMQAVKDKEELVKAGLDEALIENLSSYCSLLRETQANWMSDYLMQKDARIKWKEEAPKAYKLREELIHHFRFAFRKDPEFPKVFQRILKGHTHAHMIQSLKDLCRYGERNKVRLEAINMDLNLLEEADLKSSAMADLLAQVNSLQGGKESKLIRDKAYTLVTKTMREIREVGKYVFWKDKKHREKYMS